MAGVHSLFRSVPFLRWFSAGVLGRLAAATAPIAMLVVGTQSYGSLPIGARLAAVVSVSTAVLAPVQGRRLDRRGVSHGLQAALWQSTLAGALMAAVVYLRVGAPWVDLMAAVLGLTLAVVPAGFRTLLTEVVDDRSLPTASNLDAVGFEISLITAPLVVAAVAAVSQPALIFLVGSALTGVAAVVVPGARETAHSTGPRQPWRLPLPGVMSVALLLGVSGGLLEPAVFARVEEIGSSESVAAVLLAVVGVGSALGGIVASARPPSTSASTVALLLVWHGVAVAALVLGGQVWTLAVGLLLAGAPIAPLMAVGATVLDRGVPSGQRSTAFALAGSAIALGTGIGQGLAGALLTAGATPGVFVAAAGVALATAATIVWWSKCGSSTNPSIG